MRGCCCFNDIGVGQNGCFFSKVRKQTKKQWSVDPSKVMVERKLLSYWKLFVLVVALLVAYQNLALSRKNEARLVQKNV